MRCYVEEKYRPEKGFTWTGEQGEIARSIGIEGKEKWTTGAGGLLFILKSVHEFRCARVIFTIT